MRGNARNAYKVLSLFSRIDIYKSSLRLEYDWLDISIIISIFANSFVDYLRVAFFRNSVLHIYLFQDDSLTIQVEMDLSRNVMLNSVINLRHK